MSAATVVLVKVPAMPPMVSVVTVSVAGVAALVCRTQTVSPLLMVPSAGV